LNMILSLSLILVLLSSLSLLFISAQQTGVTCSSVTPISVPRDPSLYWGTWYTISPCRNCTNPANVCSQVAYEPVDRTNIATNVSYIGSYQLNSPEGANRMAFGTLSPLNFDTFDPLYKLELDVGIIVKSNFWILTTAGSDGEITAIVTMSCELSGTNQQIFFLSRKPYLVPPVTFDYLASQVQRAITNFDQFDMAPVLQQQGWCDYQLVETETLGGNSCSDEDEEDKGWKRLVVALVVLTILFSFGCLLFLIWIKFSTNPEKKRLLSNL